MKRQLIVIAIAGERCTRKSFKNSVQGYTSAGIPSAASSKKSQWVTCGRGVLGFGGAAKCSEFNVFFPRVRVSDDEGVSMGGGGTPFQRRHCIAVACAQAGPGQGWLQYRWA